MKTCRICGEEKDDSGFQQNRLQCKLCKAKKDRQVAGPRAAERTKRWLERHPEYRLRRNQLAKSWYARFTPEQKNKKAEYQRNLRRTTEKWKIAHRANSRAWRDKKYQDPAYRALASAKAQAWMYANYEKHLARVKSREAAKRGGRPKWANEKEIRNIYREARRISLETGVVHHVDHIVPLIHPLVCGLHCEANLQILEARRNIAKSNRSWPEMPA